MAAPASTAADVLVIFGITGDLAKKICFPGIRAGATPGYTRTRRAEAVFPFIVNPPACMTA